MKMAVFPVLLIALLSAVAPLPSEALNVRGHLLKSKTFLSPAFFLGPGSVSNKYYHDVDFPRGHLAFKSFNAEVVDQNGVPVPLHETYLHHWVVEPYYALKNSDSAGAQKLPKRIMARNSGVCKTTLGQYYGLGSETRHTATWVPDPYGIEIGNPDSPPEGYEEKWMVNVHAIDTRGVTDKQGCTECKCDLYNVTVDEYGRTIPKDYTGGLYCCYDQTQCQVREGFNGELRKLFLRYTVMWLDWSDAVIPVKIYIFARRRQLIRQQRKALPIASVEKRLVEEVRKNDTLIVVGETGSGKTTQLPQFLYDAGFCQDGKVIGITQPRRVAAVTVAKRVAEECNAQLGRKVGYSIRFDDSTSNATRIKYMTDGLLLRETLLDPLLSKYSVIVVDEAHERTVHTDVLVGLLKKVQHSRSIYANRNENTLPDRQDHSQNFTLKACQGIKFAPLKLIIMSASLDAKCFSDYFGGAKAVHIQGRQYPVDILYTYQPESDYLDATLVTIFQIHSEEGPGDILAFLTGQEEIESLERLIKDRVRQLPAQSSKIWTTPIYSSLPSEQQMNAFNPAPAGTRKVVLATNIAETSVTIPGIKYVIDPGMVKARAYNPVTGMESLIIIPVSKAQALQRSGRAGREGPGKCFRLFQESEFDKLVDSTLPEIKRCNLSNVVLQLKALEIDDIIGFDFMEKPSRTAILKSLEQLILLGALTDDYKLSDPVGHRMARLPLDPMYSKALIVSSEFKCLEEMLIVVSMLSVESIFFSPREKLEEARAARKSFESSEGDHITLVNVYRAAAECLEKSKNANAKEKTMEKALNRWSRENFINYRSLRHARDVHSQIQGHVQQMGLNLSSCGDDMVQFRRCLTAAFFLNAATRQPDGSYRALATSQSVQIHPSSVLFRTKPDCVIFNELVRTTQNYVKNLTRIDPLWLAELAPQYYATEE